VWRKCLARRTFAGHKIQHGRKAREFFRTLTICSLENQTVAAGRSTPVFNDHRQIALWIPPPRNT
jgi:hypothetical protein